MNRAFVELMQNHRSIPHTRGDEPGVEMTMFPEAAVFPTRVGMNRAV